MTEDGAPFERAESERGEKKVVKRLERVLRERHGSGGGKPSKLEGEEENEENAQIELRYRHTDEGRDREGVVLPGSVPEHTEHPCHTADHACKEHAQ